MRAVGIDPDQRGAAAELARKAELSETQVNRWLKKGHQPSIENLRKIAPVLHLRMADLLIHAGHISADELDSPEASSERAILNDTHLAERDRRILLTMLAQMRDKTGYSELTPEPPGPEPDAEGDDEPQLRDDTG